MLQQVISRKEAIELGLKRYHGNCAKHGLVERFICDGKCVVCDRQRVRKGRRKRKPEYMCWAHLIGRCTNPNHIQWNDYGGRGLEVYRPWRESFECFLQHVGPKRTPQHSLDRKNNSYGYFPGNVRWSTAKEQANNRRKPQKRTKVVAELAIAA